MIKLPFIVEPKIETCILGNPQIGEVEIPKYWGLSSQEEEFIALHTANLPESYKLAVQCATNIASVLNAKIIDVANALLLSDYDFFKDNLGEIFKFNDLSRENAVKGKLVMATAIIKYRLVSEWTLEDTYNPDQIPPRLVEKIGDFAFNERLGWQDEESEPDKKDEESEPDKKDEEQE
ncbi:hypothetical protein JYQ62_22125 [Nostoc sp. UHCC 0702]|nr:hypothetical protein JYQ62_22125 [Nostoc sp. UHCC 0702]